MLDSKQASLSPSPKRQLRSIISLARDEQTMARLNLDVYDCIMSFLEPDELTTMMRTCRALHSVGIKYLVNHPYPFNDSDVLKSYCRFVFGDAPRRGAALRAISLNLLHIHYPSLPDASQTIRVILELLSQAPNIQRTQIAIPSPVLDLYPQLLRAPSLTRSLKSLGIINCSMVHAELIRELQSPLEEVYLRFRPGSQEHPRTVIWLLGKFCSTLQNIDIEGFPFGDEDSTLFPHVRILAVSVSDASHSIGVLYRLFPGVTDVEFIPFGLPTPSQLLDQYRSRNTRCSLTGRWLHLQRLSGSIEDIYTMALTCRIDHLSISADFQDAQKLCTVTTDARPHRLTVELNARLDSLVFNLPSQTSLNLRLRSTRTPMTGQPA
ncbi:hypothetical protein OBBRIDRAFT_348218 [Obba rivulosa]|uniref:F-box domain-containing protein n=1 Tax=Obba rivulosa TaxID=1052685 RepID=A0A8E2AQQ5_9APHY|nr:hypothetical protein OBBRIDRAFT_348218 [Obba rivulosa]